MICDDFKTNLAGFSLISGSRYGRTNGVKMRFRQFSIFILIFIWFGTYSTGESHMNQANSLQLLRECLESENVLWFLNRVYAISNCFLKKRNSFQSIY